MGEEILSIRIVDIVGFSYLNLQLLGRRHFRIAGLRVYKLRLIDGDSHFAGELRSEVVSH